MFTIGDSEKKPPKNRGDIISECPYNCPQMGTISDVSSNDINNLALSGDFWEEFMNNF
jgi:hypothetical protein